MKQSQDKSFFPFEMDKKPGFFLGRMLSALIKKIKIDDKIINKLNKLNSQGTVVYAVKYKGLIDYLIYHYRFQKNNIPYPKISLNLNLSLILPVSQFYKIVKYYLVYLFKHGKFPSPFQNGFFANAIQVADPSLLSLIDPKGFTRQFIHAEKDALHFLIETQKDLSRPIFLVPQVILFRKSQEKESPTLRDIFFGYKEKPGVIRMIILLIRQRRHTIINFGKILNLKDYLNEQLPERTVEEMAAEIRRILIDNIDDQKRIVLGPVMKSRQQLKEMVLNDKKVAICIKLKSKDHPRRLRQERKKAARYFEEIAADYNVTYIQFLHMFLGWLWKKMFQGIDVDQKELDLVKESARKGPLIYVPSHKSHIDYLLLNDLLYNNSLHVPRTAAGKNLAFWPMGHIFRKSGAFFIRRSFKGARLYLRVFNRYIMALLDEGHPIEFYIEGGRSRNGKLILPKSGFLSILLKAYRQGCCQDLIFIPTSISYDVILEGESYLKEIGGEEKKDESFKQILKARHFLKRKHGKVYVRFGTPIPLTEYINKYGKLGTWDNKQLAFDLAKTINKIIIVTPLALIAFAILTRHRRGFHFHELLETTKILLEFLKDCAAPMATTLNQPEQATEETISILISRKIVNILEDVEGAERFYFLIEEKKPELEYYKNNIIHCFVLHSFMAISLFSANKDIKNSKSVSDDYFFLKRLFKKEFVYEEEQGSNKEFERVMSYFLKNNLITKTDMNGGYSITRLGFDVLPFWSAVSKTFLESYWIASRVFIQKIEKTNKKKELLKRMTYLGNLYHKQGLIDHIEAISQVNFSNAIQCLSEMFLTSQADNNDKQKVLEDLSQFSQRLYELSR